MEKESIVKMSLFLLICTFQGFCNNAMQSTISRFIFSFGENEISSYTSGTAIAGVGCALVAFV